MEKALHHQTIHTMWLDTVTFWGRVERISLVKGEKALSYVLRVMTSSENTKSVCSFPSSLAFSAPRGSEKLHSHVTLKQPADVCVCVCNDTKIPTFQALWQRAVVTMATKEITYLCCFRAAKNVELCHHIWREFRIQSSSFSECNNHNDTCILNKGPESAKFAHCSRQSRRSLFGATAIDRPIGIIRFPVLWATYHTQSCWTIQSNVVNLPARESL